MHGLTCAKRSLRTSRESTVDLFALGSGCFARESSASAICYLRVYCAEQEVTSAKQRRDATYLSACQATLHGKALPSTFSEPTNQGPLQMLYPCARHSPHATA